MTSNPAKCNGTSKYFTKREVDEAFTRFGCNTTDNFAKLLDVVVEENFEGDTTKILSE